MTLGFCVDELLPKARGGGRLKIGLSALSEDQWLAPNPDLALRKAGFDAFPNAMQLTPKARAPGQELAAMLGLNGGLEQCARNHWEDMCLLSRRDDEEIYRFIGAAVAFPSDWDPAEKIGRPLAALHAPIEGYQEQLASSVDRFMTKLKPNAIYGRSNWFITPTDDLRWVECGPAQEAFAHVSSHNAGDNLYVRCERQTLRRLPQTGAILFTIGVYVSPLSQLSPSNLERLSRSITTLPPQEARRRGIAYYSDAFQSYTSGKRDAR